MFKVEKLQTENCVLNQILRVLANEGFVTIAGENEEKTGETTLRFALRNRLYNALNLFLNDRTDCFVASDFQEALKHTN